MPIKVNSEPEVSKFSLDGVTLIGSFQVQFSKGKWNMTEFKFTETEVSTVDIKKLQSDAKAGNAVEIQFGNGKGKAAISDLKYDPQARLLRRITFELKKWQFE